MSFVATDEDRTHLRRALELAERGRGRVSPNPIVGAVIAGAGGEVVGEGLHAELGGAHAEVAALADCRAPRRRPGRARRSTSSLEPCAHHGRQPPCTDAILAAGLGRVVIGCDDPTEKASGRGPGILRDEGVEVEFADGAEAAAARLANQPFRKHARTGRPLVTLKSALSLDGFTATASGDSRWISGPESRALVHRWRAESDAVAVGIGTALADDPLLTARDVDDPERAPAGAGRLRLGGAAAARLRSSSARSTRRRCYVVAATGADRGAGRGAARRRRRGDRGRRRSRARRLARGARRARSPRDRLAAARGRRRASPAPSLDAGEVDELRLFIAPLVLGGGAAAGRRRRRDERIADAAAPLAIEWDASRRGHAGERAAAGVVMFTGIVRRSGPCAAIERGEGGARSADRGGLRRRAAGGRLGLRRRRLPDRDRAAARRLRRRRDEPDARR